jgi:hypothetical protein
MDLPHLDEWQAAAVGCPRPQPIQKTLAIKLDIFPGVVLGEAEI